ncbi:hypothetical protein ABZY31_02070 [Streptomyces sp. NPDC006529]|uniref:hypothetical protein n=1 Tax=Streptomyces sp. NPDC006529 TaxID=3157177 RepID=UPI0033AAB186
MRLSRVRPWVVGATVVSLGLSAAGCGPAGTARGKDGPKGTETSEIPSAAASGPAAKTRPELVGMLVGPKDLPAYVVATHERYRAFALATTFGSTEAACSPLSDTQAGVGVGAPAEAAAAKAAGRPEGAAPSGATDEERWAATDAPGAAIVISLSSYGGGGAVEALAELRKAAVTCAAGYATAHDEDAGKVTRIAPTASVVAGDESVAYTVERNVGGDEVISQLVVVRKGNVLASFTATPSWGRAEQPRDIIQTQIRKLD